MTRAFRVHLEVDDLDPASLDSQADAIFSTLEAEGFPVTEVTPFTDTEALSSAPGLQAAQILSQPPPADPGV